MMPIATRDIFGSVVATETPVYLERGRASAVGILLIGLQVPNPRPERLSRGDFLRSTNSIVAMPRASNLFGTEELHPRSQSRLRYEGRFADSRSNHRHLAIL